MTLKIYIYELFLKVESKNFRYNLEKPSCSRETAVGWGKSEDFIKTRRTFKKLEVTSEE
jgi:hypothetical protein